MNTTSTLWTIEATGSRILLFVRKFKQDRVMRAADAYTYLGRVQKPTR